MGFFRCQRFVVGLHVGEVSTRVGSNFANEQPSELLEMTDEWRVRLLRLLEVCFGSVAGLKSFCCSLG